MMMNDFDDERTLEEEEAMDGDNSNDNAGKYGQLHTYMCNVYVSSVSTQSVFSSEVCVTFKCTIRS